MLYDLITTKQAVRDLFPQLRDEKFILWKPEGVLGNVFKIQCYVYFGDNNTKELYGNEYYVDLDLKTITI